MPFARRVAESKAPARERVGRAGMGFAEFIILIALLNSVVALAIDIMLPALPQIGDSLNVTRVNDRQAIIVSFALGFGLTQILFGPISDRFGRRAVLLPALVFYAVCAFAAAFVESFTALLILRVAHGVGASAVRIVTTAIIRDCFGGREMSRVMSYVFSVFMIVPIIAPSLGQGFILVGTWHWIFVFLGVFGTVLLVWTYLRLQETLPQDARRPLSFSAVREAFGIILSNRISVGYGLASMLCYAGLYAYITSAQQIFDTIYGMVLWFAPLFGATAGFMAVFGILNGRIVRRTGMRLISHWSMVLYAALGVLLLLFNLSGPSSFAMTYVVMVLMMSAFGLMAANFNSIAMEPLGAIAGTATSLIGIVVFTGGAVIGGGVGQAFDGTLLPFSASLAGFGLLVLAVVLWTEKGRLFSRHDA